MLKLLIIPLYVLFIYSIKQAYCDEQKQNDFINNFLNKLITSKKFDELADIIAEKAARKIQALDKINGSQPQLGETKNNVNRSFKKKYSDDDISNETDEKGGSKPRSVTNNKLFNINPKVFKQFEPQEELSLNYRYLLKKSPYNRDGNGRDTVKLSEDNYKYDDHQKKIDSEIEEESHRSNSNKETIKNNDSEDMQKEQIANKKSQSDESSKSKHPESSEDEDRVEVTRSYRTEKFSNNGRDEKLPTNEKFDTKDSEDSEEVRPRTQQQLKKQSTNNNHLQTVRQSNEVKENEVIYEDSDEKLKPSKGNNEITTFEKKANLKNKNMKYNPPHITEDQVTIEKVIPHLTTNQIREEAGKQLIYETAPEYHEYFEKLAKSKPPSIEKFLT